MKRIFAVLFFTIALTSAFAHDERMEHGHGGYPGNFGFPGHFGPGYGPGYGPGFGGYGRPLPPPVMYPPVITPYNYMNYIGYQQFGYYMWQPIQMYYYWVWFPMYQPRWWTPYFYTTPYWNGYYL